VTTALIETGILSAGHPYARIGTGSRIVLYLPGLSFTANPSTVSTIRRSWKAWLEPITRYDLTVVQVGRRADLAPGSTPADVADDYAAVIREQWEGPVRVFGISTGGHYAQWLAIRHPDLVDRLVLGFTAHRVPAEPLARQNRAVAHFTAGRWRAGWAEFGPFALPRVPRLASGVLWLLGPYVGGRYSDLRVLAIDAHADDTHDSTAYLGKIRCRTLVASGGRDLAYPPDIVRELVAGLPDARHIEYPKAGHLGPGKAFAEDVCAFLASEH
jgi:pimeloyl-ACP methyl ester carboxylesterase